MSHSHVYLFSYSLRICFSSVTNLPFFGLQACVGNCQIITNTNVVANCPPILTKADTIFKALTTRQPALIFYRASYASTVLAVIVCLSVRPSVCPYVRLSDISRSCTKMAKHRITITTPHDSPASDSSFLVLNVAVKFLPDHPQRGRQIEVGRFESALFDQYLAIS